MDDSAKSGAGLEVSVSFGRFENDALSWEKWSSFSPNKYLEEVGTLSTPGSVAQKKAYFEAHYKKIAARKAEEMELEKSMSPLTPSPNMSSKEDFIENSSENNTDSGSFNDERLTEEAAEEEACVSDLKKVVIASAEKDSAMSSKEDDEGASVNGMVDNIAPEEETSASVAAESAIQEAKDVKNVGVDSQDSNVGKETPQKDSRRLWERPQESKKGLKQLSVLKKENSKPNTRNIAQKVTPMNKERNLPTTRKKIVTPPSKPLPAATPKYTKPTSISSPMSASQSVRKKVNSSAPSKLKSSQAGQSKRVAPTSLHMSLSLGPAESMGALPMRKSLIMDSMGDKDIVKRAFKSFQNRTNGFTSDEKHTAVKHVSSAASEPKRSSYHTPTKGNEGLKKEAEKRASQSNPCPSGTRSNPLPTGLRKNAALDKKTPTISSPATGLRSDEKAERRREFIKKLGAKSIAREAENAQHAAKTKAGVENKTRQRPSTNS